MTNKSYAIEVVIFEANPEYSKEEVKKALTSLNDIVKLYYGFIDRTTASNAEGKYVDIVYWTDIEAAKKAGEDIMKNPMAEAIFKVIKPESVQMHHMDVFNQFEE
ncbi:hypothetical protein [Aquimarina sp. 2201CG14-23]|uniref:hypothetical protein n=1 Tax=Aquimarina mycalae TaxID=3040073 RepID=UPI002477D8AF|nr:hypothetical protein [Aquimarina sp. 2201CG14-23]MDH7446466.1 hypothetical protein [Aquimarina sp. 2201CG14-23]